MGISTSSDEEEETGANPNNGNILSDDLRHGSRRNELGRTQLHGSNDGSPDTVGKLRKGFEDRSPHGGPRSAGSSSGPGSPYHRGASSGDASGDASDTSSSHHAFTSKFGVRLTEDELLCFPGATSRPTQPIRTPINTFTEARLLSGHQDLIRVVLKLDSDRFVTASDDGMVRVWDSVSGALLQEMQPDTSASDHVAPVTALLALDKAHLVCATSNGVRLWNTETGAVALSSQSTTSPGTIKGFCRINSKQFLGFSTDQTLSLWRVDTACTDNCVHHDGVGETKSSVYESARDNGMSISTVIDPSLQTTHSMSDVVTLTHVAVISLNGAEEDIHECLHLCSTRCVISADSASNEPLLLVYDYKRATTESSTQDASTPTRRTSSSVGLPADLLQALPLKHRRSVMCLSWVGWFKAPQRQSSHGGASSNAGSAVPEAPTQPVTTSTGCNSVTKHHVSTVFLSGSQDGLVCVWKDEPLAQRTGAQETAGVSLEGKQHARVVLLYSLNSWDTYVHPREKRLLRSVAQMLIIPFTHPKAQRTPQGANAAVKPRVSTVYVVIACGPGFRVYSLYDLSQHDARSRKRNRQSYGHRQYASPEERQLAVERNHLVMCCDEAHDADINHLAYVSRVDPRTSLPYLCLVTASVDSTVRLWFLPQKRIANAVRASHLPPQRSHTPLSHLTSPARSPMSTPPRLSPLITSRTPLQTPMETTLPVQQQTQQQQGNFELGMQLPAPDMRSQSLAADTTQALLSSPWRTSTGAPVSSLVRSVVFDAGTPSVLAVRSSPWLTGGVSTGSASCAILPLGPVRSNAILIDELVGHSASVTHAVVVSPFAFVTCGTDGLVILWKDHQMSAAARALISAHSLITEQGYVSESGEANATHSSSAIFDHAAGSSALCIDEEAEEDALADARCLGVDDDIDGPGPVESSSSYGTNGEETPAQSAWREAGQMVVNNQSVQEICFNLRARGYDDGVVQNIAEQLSASE